MSLLERVLYFHQEIAGKRYPNTRSLMAEFEVSKATAKRDIAYLRDRLLAPLVFSTSHNGYYYSDEGFSLPFIQGEKIALLLAMLGRLAEEAGLDQLPEVRQLENKLSNMLGSDYARLLQDISCEWIETETLDPGVFEQVISGLARRRCLAIDYRGTQGRASSREIFPLRLLNYQGRWYLRAYCTLRQDKRLFHLARIVQIKPTDTPIPPGFLDDPEDLGQAFGIFKGPARYQAEILFTSVAAELVRFQRWHRLQQIRETDDGLILQLPVSDDRELIMKILQYGSMARVLSPPELVARVRQEAVALATVYPQD